MSGLPDLIDLRRVDHLLPWTTASLHTLKWRGTVTWLERRGQHLFAHREGMLADLRGRGLDAKALEIETLLHEEGNR